MLEDVKKIMGINNNEFDEIIDTYILSGKYDLKMAGIVEVSDDDPLIYSALVSYVLSLLDTANAELYSNAYLMQKDQLRHYGEYTNELH